LGEHTVSVFRIEAARVEGKDGRPQGECEIFIAILKPERAFNVFRFPEMNNSIAEHSVTL
jgi:hypothetical protein